jgi:hypothetical protein
MVNEANGEAAYTASLLFGILVETDVLETGQYGFTIRARIEDERVLPLFYAHFSKSRDFAEMIKTVGLRREYKKSLNFT